MSICFLFWLLLFDFPRGLSPFSTVTLFLPPPHPIGDASKRAQTRARSIFFPPLVFFNVGLTSVSVQSEERNAHLKRTPANRVAVGAVLMLMCWQGRRSGSFIFSQRRGELTRRLLYMTEDQNWTWIQSRNARRRSFLFQPVHGKKRTFSFLFHLSTVCLHRRINR